VQLLSLFKKRFFSKQEEKRIVAAIRVAEANTSGEVRVHFSSKLKADVLTDAKDTFNKLGMHLTEKRNGVLIFVVPSEKQFAIIGDEGFHLITGDDFWKTVKDKMQGFFRDGNFAEGIVSGLEEVAVILKEHFPKQDNDKNELKDEISYGE
jgi:uncharacterized membrane protein